MSTGLSKKERKVMDRLADKESISPFEVNFLRIFERTSKSNSDISLNNLPH